MPQMGFFTANGVRNTSNEAFLGRGRVHACMRTYAHAPTHTPWRGGAHTPERRNSRHLPNLHPQVAPNLHSYLHLRDLCGMWRVLRMLSMYSVRPFAAQRTPGSILACLAAPTASPTACSTARREAPIPPSTR